MPSLATTPQSSMQHVVEHGIGALLVFEYSYFLLQAETGMTSQQCWAFAVRAYQTSDVKAKVHQLIQAAFMEHGEDMKNLCPILVDIAQENQMSKSEHRR
ncbi:hypothetical protein BKA82DRAFT_1006718 [Pisolithus tinctorius]|uniref:Uncharacterized protein n=1 Tax=Pisolithus tinctorius Marx 270 TaxID=870435 RepID=A0A0C3IHP0_PISTI|nr:hypothetical protein BKA82DRAFT_1006718 [Pisolithus tinctorius]KIN96552.1 hypothetical protein M404DRAFT_1006718 [Pisolithus tinctorius Marx 270]